MVVVVEFLINNGIVAGVDIAESWVDYRRQKHPMLNQRPMGHNAHLSEQL